MHSGLKQFYEKAVLLLTGTQKYLKPHKLIICTLKCVMSKNLFSLSCFMMFQKAYIIVSLGDKKYRWL